MPGPTNTNECACMAVLLKTSTHTIVFSFTNN